MFVKDANLAKRYIADDRKLLAEGKNQMDYLARQHYQQELKYLFELPEDTYAVSYIDVDSWRIISQRRQLIQEGTLQSCYTVESLCEAALDSIVDKESKVADFYCSFQPEILRKIYDGCG